MIKFALQGLLARKLRTALTAIGIVLGVSLISGTYVLTDSISSAFDSIFSQNYKNTDAAITGKPAFDLSDDGTQTAPPFAADVLQKVRDLPEVGAADGAVTGEAQLIGKDGKAIVFGGAPNLGFSVDPSLPQFNSLSLVKGDWPGADEVVIDTKTAAEKGFQAGDTIGVQARGAVEPMRIAGLVSFGAVSSIGGATLAGFDLGTAQRLFDKAGKLDQILIAAKQGVDRPQLLAAVQKILPPATQVRSAEDQAAEDAAGTSEFLGFLQTFLLVFGGIALFVGSFVIANSLSITIAQRTREFATLRTLGAARKQILGTVVLEALVTGIVSAVAGLFLGLAIATGLFKLFDAIGFTLPNNGLVFRTRTIVVALVVGVVVTVLASLRPAMRATRVPPIAAVREGATLPPGRFHRYRSAGAVVVAVVGIGTILVGLFVDGLATRTLLILLGLGVLLLFVGIASFSARLVRPMAAVSDPVARWSVVVLTAIAWPFVLFPLWLIRRLFRRPAEFPGVLPDGPAVTLGGQNSRRDPRRTASTAAALMIGLALVTLVATLGAGIIKPFEDAVDKISSSDYALTAQNNFSPLPPTVAAAAEKLPGVTELTSVRAGQAKAFDKTISVTAIDETAPKLLRFDWRSGSQASLSELAANGAIVDSGYADEHSLALGSTFQMQTVTGKLLQLTVRGIFKPPAGGSPFGNVTISTSDLRLHDHPAAEPLQLPQHRRRSEPGEHRRAERRPGLVPERQGRDHRAVQGQPDRRHQEPAERALRVAGAVCPGEPVRHREHPRPDRVRADPRTRHAARDRPDPRAGETDDPPGVRDDGADRRGDRDRPRPGSRILAGCAAGRDQLHGSGRPTGRLRRRLGRRRHRRRDLAGPARGEARPARGAPVRVVLRTIPNPWRC